VLVIWAFGSAGCAGSFSEYWSYMLLMLIIQEASCTDFREHWSCGKLFRVLVVQAFTSAGRTGSFWEHWSCGLLGVLVTQAIESAGHVGSFWEC